MSPRKFEEIVAEYEAEGLDVEELRSAWEASPLRRERDELKAQAQAAIEDAKRYKSVVATQRLKDLGVTIKPDALRYPDDLDWVDEDKVRSWFQESGIVPPPPPPGDNISDEERAAHDRIEQSRTGATAPNLKEDLNAQIAAATSPEEVMALLSKAGVPSSQDAY